MAICSGFTHWKWWFSIVMLVYQRVGGNYLQPVDVYPNMFIESYRRYEKHLLGLQPPNCCPKKNYASVQNSPKQPANLRHLWTCWQRSWKRLSSDGMRVKNGMSKMVWFTMISSFIRLSIDIFLAIHMGYQWLMMVTRPGKRENSLLLKIWPLFMGKFTN